MSNETIVQNGATGGIEDKKQNVAGASVGKIGRLPKKIREEFNQRIEDGQPGSEILPWVNELPAVKTILDKYFRGVPISDGNLSLWRRTGFKHWQEKQESLAELKMLAEDAKEFSEATDSNLARGAASIATAKILKRLNTISSEQGSIDELTKISYAVTALLNAEQSQVRLEYEKTRVYQGNERLVLSWDKFLRGCVDAVQRALNDEIAKDIQAADIDNGEKIELLGHEMFGRKWKGRILGEKKEEKKEAADSKKESAESSEPGKGDAQAPDQQVRSTATQGHCTEVKVSPVEEKAEMKEQEEPAEKKTDVQERPRACVPTATVGSVTNPVEPKASTVENASHEPAQNSKSNNSPSPCPLPLGEGALSAQQHVPTAVQGHSTEAKVSGGETAMGLKASGGLPTAATKPVVELSPYEKALLEGKTHLEAMYAQYSRLNNPAPKPPVDPSVPEAKSAGHVFGAGEEVAVCFATGAAVMAFVIGVKG